MRILMLGNSLTSANDLPGAVARLTGAHVAAHTRGGARLAEQLNPDTRMGAATLSALRDERWDCVVLQESSNGPVVHRESFLRSAEGLCTLARQAEATPVLYATWAYRPGCAKLARMEMDFEEMAQALDEAYREAAMRGGALLADVGGVFRARGGDAVLYAADGLHPSELGTRLAAEIIARLVLALPVALHDAPSASASPAVPPATAPATPPSAERRVSSRRIPDKDL